MRPFLFLMSAVSLYANGLLTLIDAAHRSDLVKSYEYKANASSSAYDALYSAYLPHIDIGINANIVDKQGSIDVGETYSAYAKAGVVILDGFKRENALDEQSALMHSNQKILEAYKKELSLKITELYFSLQSVKNDIKAQQERRYQLQEQLKRQTKFYDARIATLEDVERIRSEVAKSDYEIANLMYEKDEYVEKLYEITGIIVDDLVSNSLQEPQQLQSRELETVSAMRLQSDAAHFAAEQSVASYYPTLSIDNTYTFYDYHHEPQGFPIERVDHQNRLMATLSMNLLDFSSALRQKESITAQKLSIDSQIRYEQKRAQSNLKLSKRAIERSKILIRAAKSALNASEKTFNVIEKKYNARVSDYVKYLDALTQKTQARSQYYRALNTLEIAYAQYYYYAGYDIKEFVK